MDPDRGIDHIIGNSIVSPLCLIHHPVLAVSHARIDRHMALKPEDIPRDRHGKIRSCIRHQRAVADLGTVRPQIDAVMFIYSAYEA